MVRNVQKHSRLIIAIQFVGIAIPFLLFLLLQQGVAIPGMPAGALIHGTSTADATMPFRASPMVEQSAAIFTFFGLKFLYTLVAATIIAALWRSIEPDLVALRWAMIAFFIGEMCCFFSVMLFGEHSFLLEHLHSVGMVLTFGYTTYALLEGIDRRLIHFSDETRCAASGLCHGCIKHVPMGCGLRRVFLLLVPGTAVLAAIPLFSSFREFGYNTMIFGAAHVYRHPLLHQYYELRYLPWAAIVLLGACFAVLLLIERHPVPFSKMLFAAAAGAIGFSFFRLVLVAVFVDNQVWFAAWEEATELLYVALAGGILLIFRRGLFPVRSTTPIDT